MIGREYYCLAKNNDNKWIICKCIINDSFDFVLEDIESDMKYKKSEIRDFLIPRIANELDVVKKIKAEIEASEAILVRETLEETG